LSDHLGSVRDVVDNSGAVLNHVVYDAFGGVTSQTNASVVFRYGYTARELDAESGLQYNRARYLDSFTGKFISEDPISFAGGDSNLYRYVFNSPIGYSDPSGLSTQTLVRPPLAPLPIAPPPLAPPPVNGFLGALGSILAPVAAFATTFFAFTQPVGDATLPSNFPRPNLNPRNRPVPDSDEEPLPFMQKKAPNPSDCKCEESKRENNRDGKIVFFGQKRASPNLSRDFNNISITELARQLETCERSANDIKLKVFRDPFGSGRLVSEGTRRLAALSIAKLLPTNLEYISPGKYSERLGEEPLFRHPPGAPRTYPKLPSPVLPITLEENPRDRNKRDQVLYEVKIPGYENY
jgi:RHS repeat-associated protein